MSPLPCWSGDHGSRVPGSGPSALPTATALPPGGTGTAYFVQYAIGEPLPIAVPTNIGNVEAYDIDEGNVAGRAPVK